MLGKKQFTKKGEDVKAEKLAKDREIKAKSAIRIQAMVRGVLGREAYHEKAPQLRIERKKRSFCVECEDNVVTASPVRGSLLRHVLHKHSQERATQEAQLGAHKQREH